jgi:histidinol-phosphate phosphatase family protein
LAGNAAPVVVFLDRDGVINRDRSDYVKNLAELEILPGVGKALARLKQAGVWVFVASNQACVGKGMLTVEMLGQISQKIVVEVAKEGGAIDSFLYCPHTDEDQCDCRKPAVGLFARGLSALPQPPSRIFIVGDSERDIKAGRKIGATTILVLSGKAQKDDVGKLSAQPDKIVKDLSEAVEFILGAIGYSE